MYVWKKYFSPPGWLKLGLLWIKDSWPIVLGGFLWRSALGAPPRAKISEMCHFQLFLLLPFQRWPSITEILEFFDFLSWAVFWAEILIWEVHSQDMTQNLGNFWSANIFLDLQNFFGIFQNFSDFFSSNSEKNIIFRDHFSRKILLNDYHFWQFSLNPRYVRVYGKLQKLKKNEF